MEFDKELVALQEGLSDCDFEDKDYEMTQEELLEYQYPEDDAEEIMVREKAMKTLALQTEPYNSDEDIQDKKQYDALSLSKLSGRARSYKAMLKDCKVQLSDAKDIAVETGNQIDINERVRDSTFLQIINIIKGVAESEEKTLITMYLQSLLDTIKLTNQKMHLEKHLQYISSAKGMYIIVHIIVFD